MNIQDIRQWLSESEYEGAEHPSDEASKPVTKENLVQALVDIGVDHNAARMMMTSADPSLIILHKLTDGYKDTQLVIRGDEASIAPWNNSDEYNWAGYFDGGNLYLALALLVLCAKCYPLPENAWGERKRFYVNAEWQMEKHKVNYQD